MLHSVAVKGELDEALHLGQSIPTNISIEDWLKDFQRELQSTFSLEIKKCTQEMREGVRLF